MHVLESKVDMFKSLLSPQHLEQGLTCHNISVYSDVYIIVRVTSITFTSHSPGG